MHDIDLSRIDLNLLRALDALLSEAHVTRAARRIGLTQSSMSHALGRLRELLRDPILVRSGRGMVLSARGEALREPLRRALDEIARLLREEGAFDAASSTRTFVLVCPDLLAAALPELLAALGRAAPRVRLDVRASVDAGADDRVGSADVALVPAQREGAGLRMRVLGKVEWVVLARRDHPASRRFSLDAWVSYPHVQVRVGNPGPSFVDRALASAGRARTIGLTVPSFLLAPEVVLRSDYFFTAPRELVQQIAARLDLIMLPPPIDLAAVPVAAIWHERVHSDAGHAFFRDIVARVVEAALRGDSR